MLPLRNHSCHLLNLRNTICYVTIRSYYVVCHFDIRKDHVALLIDFKVAMGLVLPGLCVGLKGGLCNVVIQVLLREMSSPVTCSITVSKTI